MLKLAKNLSLPVDFVTERIAFLARTGAGKSGGARVIFEQALANSIFTVYVDPKGDAWGIRAAGIGKGQPVLIMGGDHGDVPLDPSAGKFTAEFLNRERVSTVLDISDFTTKDMWHFMADFGMRFYQKNRDVVLVILDEADMIAGEKFYDPKTLHAIQLIQNKGRHRGFGVVVISQRSAILNKSVLYACGTLVAMQTTAPKDIRVVQDYFDVAGEKDAAKEIVSNLPTLQNREAFVYSPHVLGAKPIRITFDTFRTFDSMRTPKPGETRQTPKSIADIDLSAVQSDMAATIEKVNAEDPQKLQARIRQLEADLRKKTATPAPAADAKDTVSKQQLREANTNVAQLSKYVEALRTALESAMKFIIEINARDFFAKAGEPLDEAKIQEAIKAAVQQAMKQFEAKVDQDRRSFAEFKKQGERVLRSMEKLLDKDEVAVTVNVTHNEPFTVEPTKPRPVATRPPVEPKQYGDLQLNKKQQEILDAIAWWESIGINSPSNIQVGAVALIDPTGGHFSNLTGPLSSYGLIERGGGTIRLTDAGRAVANVPETGNTLDEYHDVLRNRVRRMKQAGGRTVDILNAIIAAGGQPLTNAEIGERVGIDHTGGHFSNTIGPLSTAGLITRNAGVVTPTDVLFPEGLS
jgi:hypothetical protein